MFEMLFSCSTLSSSPGFGLLELAGGFLPQGNLVKTARAGWKFIWLQMMRELAPQSPDGSYVRSAALALCFSYSGFVEMMKYRLFPFFNTFHRTIRFHRRAFF